jgi:hypothetical protein
VVKEVNQQKWVLNPLSNMWYSLKAEKDIFSTVNQGAGAYCFDMWLRFAGLNSLVGQFHDELAKITKEGREQERISELKNAIKKVNKKLNMHRELDIDIKFGKTYAEVH